MPRLIVTLLALCLSFGAVAADQRSRSFGALTVHYSAFNSGFLQPQIAAASGLVRSKTQGVLNVALLQDGQPVSGSVSGELKDLTGRSRPLSFRQVREGEAIYYLAQYPIDAREVLTFDLQVRGPDGASHPLTFNQEVFPDE